MISLARSLLCAWERVSLLTWRVSRLTWNYVYSTRYIQPASSVNVERVAPKSLPNAIHGNGEKGRDRPSPTDIAPNETAAKAMMPSSGYEYPWSLPDSFFSCHAGLKGLNPHLFSHCCQIGSWVTPCWATRGCIIYTKEGVKGLEKLGRNFLCMQIEIFWRIKIKGYESLQSPTLENRYKAWKNFLAEFMHLKPDLSTTLEQTIRLWWKVNNSISCR